jgi:CRISPR-associated endonuclease/helicase Cas3
MLSLFNTATNFLHHVCNATIVLSSATQPGFNHLRYPLRGCKGDIAVCDDKMRNIFRRTTITQLDSCTLEKSVPLFEDMLKKYNSMLIVCNKKDEASYLYKELRHLDCDVFHLSASMCIEHRKDVLEDIKSDLDEITASLKTSIRIEKKVLCISTQVIEAGVDLSFECAVRFTAGIDSVIQTAGRCNRSGEYGPSGDVYIFTCLDENLGRLEEIKKSKMATEELLADYRENSLRFQNCMDSLSAIDFYYKRFFRSFGEGYQEYSTKKHGTIYDLLSVNDSYTSIKQEKYDFLKQAFKTAGNEFKVFDTDAIDVIVPYEEGADIISDLNSENASWNKDFVEKALEKAKQYTVSLYSYQVKKLENLGALYTILGERAVVLQSSYYDDYVGVVDEDRNYGYLEVST